MDRKQTFGELTAKDFDIGDIVEWSIWNEKSEKWTPQYGILLQTENQIRSNRVVSISKVVPLNDAGTELEFFTLTLKLVNKP